jgi:hypothetical protein
MKTHQFTVRNVPNSVSQSLRKKAKDRNVSLNEILREALEQAAGVFAPPVSYHDLDALSGTWVNDPLVDKALRSMRTVDARDWK